jgi:hypothetical protein
MVDLLKYSVNPTAARQTRAEAESLPSRKIGQMNVDDWRKTGIGVVCAVPAPS